MLRDVSLTSHHEYNEADLTVQQDYRHLLLIKIANEVRDRLTKQTEGLFDFQVKLSDGLRRIDLKLPRYAFFEKYATGWIIDLEK